MADHSIPADSRRRRATRAAVLITLSAVVLLAWEAVERDVFARPARGRPCVPAAARSRRNPPAPGERQPARIVPPVPAAAPAAAPPAAPVDPATLHVEEIVIDPSDPAARFAVIDGVAVRAGELIGGHPVRAVLPDRVLIGEESEIVLLPPEEER
jgi:hypothetical protein